MSRIVANSKQFGAVLTLDLYYALCPLTTQSPFQLRMVRSLDGRIAADSDAFYEPQKNGEKNMADDYDYVMYGKVYKFEESKETKQV